MRKVLIRLIYSIIIFTLITLLLNCKQNKFTMDNAVIYHGIDYWILTKDSNIVNTNCELMSLRFLNNPFELDSSYNMTLTLETDKQTFLLYRGIYKETLEVCVPDTILSMAYNSPQLGLFKKNQSFLLIYKSYIKIRSDDKFLYIAFFPEEHTPSSCIMFSQKLRLN